MTSVHLRRIWQILLAYTWFVILWGAFVRASGSGDGCGKNWPTCHGQLIPETSDIATWIEYIHRASSGLYGIYVLVAIILVWRFFNKNSKKQNPHTHSVSTFLLKPTFIFPFLVLFFTIAESLIGAGLVLAGLVGSNESWARAFIMVVHLVNTFLLTGSIVGTLNLLKPPQPSEKLDHWTPYLYAINAIGLFLVASFGAITALGDTLYPSTFSAGQSLQKSFSDSTPFLIRLRIWHPVLAVLLTWSVSMMALKNINKNYARRLIFWMGSTLFIGVINLFLSAPIYMQIIHLLWAQILWAEFCLYGFKNAKLVE